MKIVCIILILFVHWASGTKAIFVKNGKLHIYGYNACNITNNGVSFNNITGSSIETGLIFGLVKYNCDGLHGSLISYMECMNCGVYCVFNDYIKGCTNKNIHLSLGIVIGLIVSSILVYTVLCAAGWFMVRVNRARQVRKQYKFDRTVARTFLLSDTPLNDYVDRYELDEIGRAKVNKNRAKLNNKYTTVNTIALITLLLIFIVDCNCCDNTLYIRSDNKICDFNECKSLDMFTFTMFTGKVICFKDVNHNLLKIKIHSLSYISRYMPQYYTSNYSISTESTYNCRGADNCTQGNRMCKDGMIYGDLYKNSGLNYYGCQIAVFSCDNYCYLSTICLYYRYSVARVGKLYKVYKYIGKIWESKIIVNYNNLERVYVFNSNNPEQVLNVNMIKDKVSIPIIITNFMSEDINIGQSIIELDNIFYSVKSSDKNMPEEGIIGDYQLSLDMGSQTFNNVGVKCQSMDCEYICSYPEPAISRVQKNIKNVLRHNDVIRYQNHIMVKTGLVGSVTLMMSNVKIDSLFLKRPQCDINVLSTYGCIACEDLPYAIMSASNIKEEGAVQFESNCTFTTSHLSCNPELYKLTLADNDEYCRINIGSLNKSIVLHFDYMFLGTLKPIYTMLGKDTALDVIKNIATNEDFIYSLSKTALYCSAIGSMIGIIVRMVRFYIVTNSIAKSNNNT